MGQGFGAVFPIVVVGIVADLLVKLLLGFKVVLLEWIPWGVAGLLSHRHEPRIKAIVAQPGQAGRSVRLPNSESKADQSGRSGKLLLIRST